MRTTWDAAAASEQVELYVGDRARGREELAGFLGRLGADPRGGVCVELGCGFGRMTDALAERFDRVLALDVSPAMLDQARKAVQASNVEFRLVSGAQLDSLYRRQPPAHRGGASSGASSPCRRSRTPRCVKR